MLRPGVPREQLRHDLLLDPPPRLDGSDHGDVRSRFHRRRPVAVDAHQRRLVAGLLQIRHHGQRHLASPGPADTLARQLLQAAPAVPRVANHHPQLFMAALDPLDLRAVEAGSELRPDGGRGEPRRLPGRGELDLQVPLAARQAVRDLVDPRHRGQESPQLGGRLPQRLGVVVLQRVRDGRPRPDARGVELRPLHVPQIPDAAAPRPLDLRGRRLPERPLVQMEPHPGQVAAVGLVRERARRRDVAGQDADLGDRFPRELLVRGVRGLRELLGGGQGRRERRADRQEQVRLHVLGWDSSRRRRG